MRNEVEGGPNAAADATEPFAPPRANVERKRAMALAGPWARWLARYFDVFWEVSVIALLMVGVIFASSSEEPLQLLGTQGGAWVFLIAVSLIAVLLDAATHRLFGNTPGKALLGLRVVAHDGSALSFLDHVKRNLRVWFSGFGLGIPIVQFFTMLYQYRRVAANKPASYDEAAKRRVIARTISNARMILAVVAFLLMLSLYVWVIVADRE